MQQTNYIDNLLSLIRKATSQFHTVEAVKDQLAKQGYDDVKYVDPTGLYGPLI